jgi:hypothetical protein
VEVPYLALQKADPAKRRFVCCISHSRWNDGFASNYKFRFTKRSVIDLGVRWVQIQDQNRLLSLSPYGRPAKPEEFSPFFWMRDSHEAKVRFLFDRMLVSTRPDPSDAGMTWFLATGDEACEPAKLKAMIEDHQRPNPIAARSRVRLEAENFSVLEGFVLDDKKDKAASQQLAVKMAAGVAEGKLRSTFAEPFTAAGTYDVVVRYLDGKDAHCKYSLFVNGAACGAAWETAGQANGWKSQKIRAVRLAIGDEVRIDAKGMGRVDFVEFERSN